MGTTTLDIIHTTLSVGPKSFGVGPVALNLCRKQLEYGFNSEIWCLDIDSEINRNNNILACGLSACSVHTYSSSWPTTLLQSRAMERVAKTNNFSDYTIVHQHGIWSGISRVANIMRQRYGIPTIIAPHGSLEEWALKISWWKKRLALSLYERENLFSASCLHACSPQEVTGFRDFGLTAPVAIIPNGISDEWLKSEGDGLEFKKQFSIPESKRILLYLSRITPVKGLPMLMEALSAIKHQIQDWILVVAGLDEFNHLKTVKMAVKNAGLTDFVMFTGLLAGQMRRNAYAAADLFVLPTLRENFALVVAEALGVGVPVITTKGAPWEELVTCDCGWWTDVSADALSVALQDAMNKTPQELTTMGVRGHALVSLRYTWKQAARMSIELYEWLLGRRGRPAFVVLN